MTMVRRLAIGAAAIGMLAAAGADAAAASPVRIGVPERENIQYISLWVALGAGYLQAEGLDPELVVAPVPNQSGQLLLDHQADVALLQPPVYLGLIAQQRPIVLFASLLANDPINLIVRSDVAAARKLDPRAPLVERLKALKGLRVGVANEPPRRLRVLLAQAGMDADRDIQMTIVPGELQLEAFSIGRVDALYTHTPFLEEALVNLGAVLMVNQSAGEIAPLSNGQIHTMGAMREYADEHPDVLLAVTRAIARAEDLLHRDGDAAAQALAKSGVPVPSPKHLATIVGLYRAAVPRTPAVSAAGVERDAVLYPARPAMPDFSRVHAADFLAPAFAEQASGATADSPPTQTPRPDADLRDPNQPFDLGVMIANPTAPMPTLSPVSDTMTRVEIRNHQALNVRPEPDAESRASQDVDGRASTFFLSPLCSGGGRGGTGTCQQAVNNVGSEIHDGVNLTIRTTSVTRLTLDAQERRHGHHPAAPGSDSPCIPAAPARDRRDLVGVSPS